MMNVYVYHVQNKKNNIKKGGTQFVLWRGEERRGTYE